MIHLSLPQIFEGSDLKGSPSFLIDSTMRGLCLDLPKLPGGLLLEAWSALTIG